MTPLERADELRAYMDFDAFNHWSELLPPGALILTPDEVEKVRQAFRTLEIGHSFFVGEREQMDDALALLAGKGQT